MIFRVLTAVWIYQDAKLLNSTLKHTLSYMKAVSQETNYRHILAKNLCVVGVYSSM